jgi:hypothetical protein
LDAPAAPALRRDLDNGGFLCISNRNTRLPPFLNAIRNFSVLSFQLLTPDFNYFHLRLEKMHKVRLLVAPECVVVRLFCAFAPSGRAVLLSIRNLHLM